MKIKIIGCGLAGITAACLLKKQGHQIDIFETRNHIGGNCYDSWLHDICVHNYGPHAFHTKHKIIWDFLNQYSSFNNHIHKVVANTKIGIISVPVTSHKELSNGTLVNLICKEYSEKQWDMKWKDIPKEITSRVKLRSDNEQYFDDEFQGIPSHGYTQMFEEMLSGISVHLDCDQHEWRNYPSDMTVWTGKIDEYFDYCYGSLDFRSLTFVYKVEPRRTHHVINECTADIPYTRSCDHSFWLKQHNPLTIISYEYPCAYKQSHFKDKDTNVPFYPIPTTKNLQILEWYQKLAQKEKTIFVGRLATYKYINMDEVILQVMEKIQWKPSP